MSSSNKSKNPIKRRHNIEVKNFTDHLGSNLFDNLKLNESHTKSGHPKFYSNLQDHNCYNDNMYKDLYSKITPELYTAFMIIPHYSIFLLFYPPIVSFMGSLIDIYQYCLITGYQLFPFIIMWFIVDEHISTKGKRVNFDYKYNDMKKTHKLSKTKINDIKNWYF